jgi:succinoglycan biosynthesis protein ExoA
MDCSVSVTMSDRSGSRTALVYRVAARLRAPVSVLMPVRNEERYLAESVGRVLRQDYDGELELIIAVGPSRDGTAQLAHKLAAVDSRIRVIDNPAGRIAAALNLALGASRHAIVVRVDGHCLLPDGYVRTAVATLRETGAANVGGIMAAEGITPFQRAVAWAMTSPFGVGSATNHTGGEAGPAETAYLGVFRRDAIEQAGGYNERFQVAEDWELNHRIRRAGGLIWFEPAMHVTYRPRATIRELAVQYFRYGRWRRELCRRHHGTLNLRYLAPPGAVVAIAAGTLASLTGLVAGARGWRARIACGFMIPICYASGVAAVGLRASRELPAAAAVQLPIALATMHMCWGIGFLTSPRGLSASRLTLVVPSLHGRRQQRARDAEVSRIRDLEIALAARDGTDRHVGEIMQHYPAVVGGRPVGETRVGVGQLVCSADHREPKALGSLAAGQGVTGQDPADRAARDLDDGVGCGHDHADGLPLVQRRDAVGNDPLVDEGPGCVVKQDLRVSRRSLVEPAQRVTGRIGPSGSAPDDIDNLGETRHVPLHLVLDAGGRYHQHLVHAGSQLERLHGVLDQVAASQDPQLLRACRAEPAA